MWACSSVRRSSPSGSRDSTTLCQSRLYPQWGTKNLATDLTCWVEKKMLFSFSTSMLYLQISVEFGILEFFQKSKTVSSQIQSFSESHLSYTSNQRVMNGYRGLWFGSYSTPSPLSRRPTTHRKTVKEMQLVDGKRVGEEPNHRMGESLVLCISFHTQTPLWNYYLWTVII